VELEAKGSIKKVPVEGKVDGSYTRSRRFSDALTEETRTSHTEGSESMGDAQPIAIEAVPLDALLKPYLFSDRDAGALESDLKPRREILHRVLTEHVFRLNPLAQALDKFSILELDVEGFSIRWTGQARDVFGGIMVRWPGDGVQDQHAGGFAEKDGTCSRTIWHRQNQAGAAATMARGTVERPMPGRRFAYYFADKDAQLDGLEFRIGVDLKERAAFEPKVGQGGATAVKLATLAALPEPLDRNEGWVGSQVMIGDVTLRLRYRRSRIGWIAPLKRLEVEDKLCKNLP